MMRTTLILFLSVEFEFTKKKEGLEFGVNLKMRGSVMFLRAVRINGRITESPQY